VSLSLISLCVLLTTCSVDPGVGPGGAHAGFSLFGRTINLTLGDVNPMTFEANVSILVPTAFRLAESAPSEVPGSGRMILPSESVSVGRRLAGKSAVRSQTLPLNGSAVLRFLIAPGASADLCGSATLLGEFEMKLTAGLAGIVIEEFDLSPQAIEAIAANEVTICIEIEADFDGELTIDKFMLEFDEKDAAAGGGPGDNSSAPSFNVGSPPPSSLLQVPIASAEGGGAVRTGANRVINGVQYGIVGVLEAATPDVTVPTNNPDSISVSPASVGLATVTQLYLALHSAFVPDVADGTTIATLTATYAGGSTTTLDLVLGGNTAEWSYERAEHVAAFGGVQHASAPVLYSFTSSVDSTSEYTGYIYGTSLDLISTRTLSRLTLSMASPATYASARAANAPAPTWAAQAIIGITLVGPALIPPAPPDPDEACCPVEGRCADMSPGDCQFGGGIALGPDTTCTEDASQCTDIFPPDDGPGNPTGACCLDDGSCVIDTEIGCSFDWAGAYQGDNTTCGGVTCPTTTTPPVVEYVIWYTGNVCCWGAPLMYITDRATFNQPRLRSSFPGGGISPTEPALKVEERGGFTSVQQARDWICPQFTASTFHYWCGRHYQYGGRNWQPGGLGCDFSSLPDVPNPPGLPAPDVCAAHAGEVPDETIACCYPNTTCVEQLPADCDAGGGTPHPDGETRCGVSPCPDPCPEDGVCSDACGDSILARDPDCDLCDLDGSCIAGCPNGDPDCCLGDNMVRNGDAESGTGASDFTSKVGTIPEWNVFQGSLTTVSYSASGHSALNSADSAEIGGGKNYFAGGPAGVSPALAQNNIFLNEYTPLWAIEEGRVTATLSAYIGGWGTHADDLTVTAVFRDELLNDVAVFSIGPVSNADRDNDSRLLYRCATINVPTNAVTAEVVITARRIVGSYNDGYVDNISLVLERTDCPSDRAGGGCD